MSTVLGNPKKDLMKGISFSLLQNFQFPIISSRGFLHFVGLAYKGKDIVFRFIIDYGSLMDFGP
jgi:hypothetical protein